MKNNSLLRKWTAKAVLIGLLLGAAGMMKGFAQYTPHWSPSSAPYNMNVLGPIELDGSYLASPAIEVGAFCGSECRGSAFLEDMGLSYYMVLQTIVGNENSEIITFRLYDHEANQEVDAVCNTTVTFVDVSLIGFDDPFVISFTSISYVPITFADANVKSLCVANWDTNSDGELSYGEAAAVTDLGEVFKNNTTITSFDELQYFTGLTAIGSNTFAYCSNLTSIKIPNSVTTIGQSAFYYCIHLTSIEIPNSVTSIGDHAFYYCTGLTLIGIPNFVTSIGDYAFLGCRSLTSIEIPNSVTHIGLGAFSGCSSLTQVVVENGNTIYDSRGNCNAIIETVTNTLITGCKNTIIPSSVTSIGDFAYFGCSGLTSIIIGNSMTSIGENAFYGCNGLTSMAVLAETPPLLGNYAYYEVNKSIHVYVPTGTVSAYQAAEGWSEFTNFIDYGSAITFADANVKALCVANWDTNNDDELSYAEASAVTDLGTVFHANNTITSFNELQYFTGLTSIESYTFIGCINLTSITIPISVTSIAGYAFSQCGLTSIVIPNSVTSIGGFAFYYCSDLISVSIGNSVASIGGQLFEPYNGIEQIVVDAGNTVYDSRGNCNAIIETSTNKLVVGCKNTIIPNTVASIGACAFDGCSGLTSIEIPNSVTDIGTWAFMGCTGLTSVSISNAVASIGANPFLKCSGLEQIVVDNDNAFYDSRSNCNAIIRTDNNTMISACKNTVIPNSVNYIKSAFAGCTGLASIIIPNSVIGIEEYAFDGCRNLTSLEIPNSVISIGTAVFRSCSSLTTIEIPNFVTTIGHEAFRGCTALNSIIIPNSVTSIGSMAFDYCTGLATITIPNAVTSIAYNAFSRCYSLTSMIVFSENPPTLGTDVFDGINKSIPVYVPAGTVSAYQAASGWSEFTNIQELGNNPTPITFADANVKALCVANWDTNSDGEMSYAEAAAVTDLGNVFEYKSTITSFDELRYFTGLTSIGDYAFQYCRGLTSIEIPNSVTYIGDNAFQHCSGLTSIEIPNSVTSIGNFAFSGCSALEQIIVNPENTVYDSQNNCNAIIKTTTHTLIAGCKNTLIPNSVTSIGFGAFYDCSGLTSIEIPNSVTSIWYGAFSGCNGLTSIEIPNSVTSIGGSAFSNCNELTSIEIPNSVATIGQLAFAYCSALEQIIVNPENTVYDSRNNCNALIETATNTLLKGCNNTTIPNSVTSIENYAFSDCSGLTSIEIPNSVTSIGKYAFNGCSGLTSIEIPNSVTSIGEGAFSSCNGLTSLIIGNSVNSIGNHTFSRCNGLTSIEIPNSVTSIGNSAFYYCSGLTSLIIGNSVTSIGEHAFNGCSGLTSIEIPNSVTSIGERAFNGCSGLTSIEIPNSVATIGQLAFAYCSALEQIIVNPENTVYDSRNNCNALIETATNTLLKGCNNTAIPNSVTSIENSAFSDCSGLTTIEIPNSVTSIGECAFISCSGLTSLIIGNSVNSIGYSAFFGCSGLTSMIVLAENPPTLGTHIFDGVNKSIPVYVPVGTVSAYQAASGWSEFSNYIEMTPCNITATANPSAGGTVEGAGTYGTGLPCTLTATPNQGYRFVNWTEAGVEVSTEATYSFTVTGERTLVANFEQITNHWTAANFKNYKAVKGVIYIDGVEQFSHLYEIGAFCGEECRASVCAALFPPTSQYVVNLTIGSNEDNYVEVITFKIYDHETQQELDVQSTNSLSLEDFEPIGAPGNWFPFTFVHEVNIAATVNPEGAGTVSGTGDYLPGAEATLTATANEGFVFREWLIGSETASTNNPYTFTVTEAVNLTACFDRQQSQEMVEGWNWWSTYIEQDGIDGLTLLENSLGHNGVLIMSQGQNVENYYSQLNYDYWWGNLASLQNEKGYKIKVTQACTAVMTGTKALPQNHPISIQPNWNWIGYPCSVSQSISAANFQPSDGDLIVKQGGNATYYAGYGWWPDFTMEPGKSYQYHSTDTETKNMVFSESRVESQPRSTRDGTHWTASNFKNYKAVKGIILIDGVEQFTTRYEIGAFCGDECRASVCAELFPPTSQYVVNLTIGSDLDNSNEQITFRIYDHEAQEELNLESTSSLTLTDFEPIGTIGNWFQYTFVTPAGLNKAITGYGTGTGNWYLIASPLVGSIAPTAVGNIFSATEYDLYRFNQAAEMEWENYKAHTEGFVLENGKGYLYASKENVTLSFTGTIYDDNGQVTLSKTGSQGWNLIGNPFGATATIGERDFYRMNNGGTEIIVAEDPNIAAMEGIFVLAASDGETITFTKATRATASEEKVVINLYNTTSAVIDRAILRFGEGSTLPKFMLDENNSQIYVPQGGSNYAVVRNAAQGELPLNFKAAKNGEYTITVAPEGVDMDYLHLIDNLTGADIDLLETTDYTFTAKTTDYESRFRLLFSANDNDGSSTGSETFAFICNGEIIITDAIANATLQIVDVTGRFVYFGNATNRVSTVGMVPGVYVLRLVDGKDVKTQKIVVQ